MRCDDGFDEMMACHGLEQIERAWIALKYTGGRITKKIGVEMLEFFAAVQDQEEKDDAVVDLTFDDSDSD